MIEAFMTIKKAVSNSNVHNDFQQKKVIKLFWVFINVNIHYQLLLLYKSLSV